MNHNENRTPKGPALIFLYNAFISFSTLLGTSFLTKISDNAKEMSASGFFGHILFGSSALFMAIILFSKKYDKWLLISTGSLLLPCIFDLFVNFSPFVIADMFCYILLLAFTFIMVKMPDTSVRKTVAKFRFIIPLYQFILIAYSTIQLITSLYERVVEYTGTHFNASVNLASILIPSITSAVFGILPLLCFVLLTNWLADPRAKKQ